MVSARNHRSTRVASPFLTASVSEPFPPSCTRQVVVGFLFQSIVYSSTTQFWFYAPSLRDPLDSNDGSRYCRFASLASKMETEREKVGRRLVNASRVSTVLDSAPYHLRVHAASLWFGRLAKDIQSHRVSTASSSSSDDDIDVPPETPAKKVTAYRTLP